ncbi:MAG: DUF5710 domain-containing protein [Polaromonas sp.]
MRINLVTPFAEKDAVKALGARWDASKKIWYITDVADLTPFSRWIPSLDAAIEGSKDEATRLTKNVPKASIHQSMGPTTKPAIEVPHCGCNVLPWEDCVHTAIP